MISPITGSFNCSLIETNSTKSLIDGYKQRLDIDVSKIFENIKSYSIYRCNDTGLKFYYTGRNLDNENFYGELSKYDWYYSPNRWEFDETTKLIVPGMRVLEIGCGRGVFVKKAMQKNADVLGLELNQHAVDQATADGLPVKKLLVQELGNEHNSSFDIVCTFQVVEHLMDLKEFLEHALRVLKPGGKLIISVPNNQSVIFHRTPIEINESQRFIFDLMNRPPHHFLCWDKSSLANLSKVFPLTVEAIRFEKMENYLLNYATEVYFFKVRRMLPKRLIRPFVKRFYSRLKGHSVLAIYTKK